jgi:glycosyltransferase involved in cell wall biosynthesis
MRTMSAAIAIVMPVYNAIPFVRTAVTSVLTQTHRDLEVWAIDDGSTDGSGALLDELAQADERLRVVHQANTGAVAALNRGIDEALRCAGDAEFIALMHADDIALPHRIQRQVEYLAARPDVDICGTWIRTFHDPTFPPPTGSDGSAVPREWHYPSDPRFTAPFLLFWCCFAHPTMMFRRRVFEGSAGAPGLRYDPQIPMPCEDYALWARASERHLMGNVPEVLLEYREHATQGGAVHAGQTAALAATIRRGLIARLGIVVGAEEMELHQRLAQSDFPATLDFVRAARAWLERLWQANGQRPIYDHEAFGKVLGGRWAALCLHAAGRGVAGIWAEFWTCPLAPFVDRALEKNCSIPEP